MIKHIQHSAIDKERWDKCIDQANNKMIYAKSWYLDIICPGWNALILDNYNAVMPIPWKNRFGVKYVYQPWLSQQLGIFSIDVSFNLDEVFKVLKSHYHLGEVCFTADIVLNNGALKPSEKKNLILPLNRAYDDIRNNYKKNHKRNCKKTYNSGLEIKENLSETEIFNLFHQTQLEKKVGWQKQHLKKIRSLMENLVPNNNGEILGVKFDGRLISAVFLLIDNTRITYLFPVSSDEGYKNLAQFYLVDQIIKKYSDKELILDFEGSNIEGIRKFYEGFGAKNEILKTIKFSRNLIVRRLSQLAEYV